MLPTIGYFTLLAAFFIVFLQILFPLIGLYRNNTFFLYATKSTAFLQLIFVGSAFCILMLLFYQNDFSVIYVAQNSNSNLPTLYRLCAVWGAHAGSLLLWIFILSAWTAAVAFFSHHMSLKIIARVLCVLGIISLFFYWFILCYSNPFLQSFSLVQQGSDLNPILQDIGLALHPPILYAGYVGFAVVFALAVASLWCGEFDTQYAKWMTPWAQLAWCFLTVGIVFGSWWSYRELGWGGFWFWDPVENASLMPWLAGTALLHVLHINQKRKLFSAWTILLSLMTFSLSLLGTFLVRSGVLISIHTFSEDPTRGLFLLRLFFFVSGASLLLFAWRAKKITHDEKIFFWSRESLILVNNILLCIALFVILLGTLYPLMIDVLGLSKISVGAPYFNIVLAPILILMFMFMIFTLKIKNIGMLISHVGFFIFSIGIVFSASFSHARELKMTVGEQEKLSGYEFMFKKMKTIDSSNYAGFKATVMIEKNNQIVARVYPELREYPVDHILLPKAGIDPGVFRDFYVALGMPLQHDQWTMQIDVKPFVRWVWAGGILMMLGGLLSWIRAWRHETV